MYHIIKVVLLTLVLDVMITEAWIDVRDALFSQEAPTSIMKMIESNCLLWKHGQRICSDGDSDEI